MVFPLIVVAALAQAPDARAELVEADRRLSAASGELGLRAALAAVLADDAVLVHAGAPVLVGVAPIRAALARDSELDSVSVTWEATHAFVSSDGGFGVTTGTLAVRRAGAGAPGTGSYIAAWRRQDGRWRVVGLMQGVAAGTPLLFDPAWGPRELPPLEPSGPAAPMIQADRDFAARAAVVGAGAAFREYAAPDAFLPRGGGPPIDGPEAIGEAIARRQADWSWYPVAAFASAAGDLGVTMGQAVIRPAGGGEPVYGKYLTVWRRQPDGSVRFLTDGGNPRPAP